jgi:Protein of unknown function (DUF3450)
MKRSIGKYQKLPRLFAALLFCILLAPSRGASPLDDVQKTVTEWVRVRAETAQIEDDWTWQQMLMKSTLEALQERTRLLEAQRTELQARTDQERRDTGDLMARRQALKDAQAQAENHLRLLGERLARMRAWLPPRLSAALELPYRSLANPDADTGERMRYAMVILNRCAQFNRMVSVGEEMITAANGEKRLMEVVYWGLSHGYALDRSGNEAYLWAPTESAWAWTTLPDMAPQVARLINASLDKAEPEFVILPAQSTHPAALNPKP